MLIFAAIEIQKLDRDRREYSNKYNIIISTFVYVKLKHIKYSHHYQLLVIVHMQYYFVLVLVQLM